MECRFPIRTFLLLAVFFIGFLEAFGQELSPDSWRQLPAADLIAVIRKVNESGWNKLSSEAQKSLKQEAFEHISRFAFFDERLTYGDLGVLFKVAGDLVDDRLKESVPFALCSSFDDWSRGSFSEMKSKIELMEQFAVDRAFVLRELQVWVQGQGKVDSSFLVDRKLASYRAFNGSMNLVDGPYSVEWNGVIEPSLDGAYQFLVSPINVNTGYTHDPVKMSMVVAVDGEEVLGSTPDGRKASWSEPTTWISESNTVFLKANQPVSLKVTVSVDPQKQLPKSTLHAMLFWKTPGSNTPTVVPEQNLSVAVDGDPGLEATYTWSQNGELHSMSRVERNIDVAWLKQPIVLTEDATAMRQAGDLRWSIATSESFIERTMVSPRTLHPFLVHPDEASESMTSPQRVAFLELLLKRPALLKPLSPEKAVDCFRAFRIGAANQALDVFGAWATQNADLPLELSTDRVFNSDVRYAFSAMAILVTQQLPTQVLEVKRRFLELSDGHCVLPVAYILAYSQIGQKKLKSWIEFLDTKLADAKLTGDKRVNWLIARAFAEELDPASARMYPVYYGIPFQDPMRGMSYLEDALRTAESSSTKVRVAREIAGRLVYRLDYQAAKTLLDSIKPTLPIDQEPVVSGLQRQIAGFIATFEQSQTNQPSAAKQAHLTELKRRRDQAAKLGDDKAAQRYETLIGALNSESSED